MSIKKVQAYADDLAYVHDVGFGGFAQRSAPGILQILHRSGVRDGLVVDLGCGSGIWARELTSAGYRVLGIDISPAMVNIASRRVAEAEFRVDSLLTASLPQCEAVTSLGECCNYLFDKQNSFDALVRLFHRVHTSLRPNGLFVFDVAEPGRGSGPRQLHREGSDWACLVDVDEDKSTQRLTRRITVFRKVDNLYRRHQETHQLQLYRGAKVAKSLRSVGFRVRTMRHYGQFRLSKALVSFVARKT